MGTRTWIGTAPSPHPAPTKHRDPLCPLCPLVTKPPSPRTGWIYPALPLAPPTPEGPPTPPPYGGTPSRVPTLVLGLPLACQSPEPQQGGRLHLLWEHSQRLSDSDSGVARRGAPSGGGVRGMDGTTPCQPGPVPPLLGGRMAAGLWDEWGGRRGLRAPWVGGAWGTVGHSGVGLCTVGPLRGTGGHDRTQWGTAGCSGAWRGAARP